MIYQQCRSARQRKRVGVSGLDVTRGADAVLDGITHEVEVADHRGFFGYLHFRRKFAGIGDTAVRSLIIREIKVEHRGRTHRCLAKGVLRIVHTG